MCNWLVSIRKETTKTGSKRREGPLPFTWKLHAISELKSSRIALSQSIDISLLNLRLLFAL